jgi:hypothetical protein
MNEAPMAKHAHHDHDIAPDAETATDSVCGMKVEIKEGARCRKTLARDTGSAAQTADVRPLPAGKAIAAAIMMCRRARMSVPSPPAAPPLFLDGDDGFRLVQAALQCRNLSVGLVQFGLQRVGGRFLRTARAGLQGSQRARRTRPAPIGQG